MTLINLKMHHYDVSLSLLHHLFLRLVVTLLTPYKQGGGFGPDIPAKIKNNDYAHFREVEGPSPRLTCI